MKAHGIKVASRDAIRKARQDAAPDAECGRIVVEDPKRRNRKKIRAWLRVLSVKDALQKTLDQQVEGGVVSWPPNFPADLIVIIPCHDKGGGSDKLVAKIGNSEKSDSPARTCLLGLSDTDDDGYGFSRYAFGPLYKQLSVFDDMLPGVFRVPWKPRLPPRIMLNAKGNPEWKPVEPAPAKRHSVVAVKLSKITWKYGGHWISVDVRPRRAAAKPASKVGTITNVLGSSSKPRVGGPVLQLVVHTRNGLPTSDSGMLRL